MLHDVPAYGRQMAHFLQIKLKYTKQQSLCIEF